MNDADFVGGVVELLEKALKEDYDTMRDSYYVWAWRRAREIHELKLKQEFESRPVIQVKMER